MRRLIAAAALALNASLSFAATSAPILTVESVLSPAWVERETGRREPLAAGMALNRKEKVHTGDGGRATLRLAEGSAVKLGESALVAVDDLARKDNERGVVAASFDVVRGAFRFTTGLLQKASAERDVKVKVNAITAGIRGTDVWGKVEDDKDYVCLLEGRISVNHGPAQFQMSEPNTFYVVPRNGQAEPPSKVSAEQVKEWSDQTEIFPQMGSARAGGQAFVRVGSVGSEAEGNALREKLRESGFPATLVVGGRAYEVRVDSLADAAEARVLADRLRRIGFPQATPQ